MSFLPSIWDAAEEHDLTASIRNVNRPGEVRINCPFCSQGDSKHHLYVNTLKNTFNCYRCGEKGGVLRFLSLLRGKSETEIVQELKKEKQTAGKRLMEKHPAEKLLSSQLRAMGFIGKPRWGRLKKRNFDYYRRTRQFIWNEWQDFLYYEKLQAFKWLTLGIITGTYLLALDKIGKRSKEIGVDILSPVLSTYNEGTEEELPDWAKEGKKLAMLYLLPPSMGEHCERASGS